MELTVTNTGSAGIQKFITILVDDHVVVNQLLSETATFTIDAQQVTVRIGEGFTRRWEILQYFGLFLAEFLLRMVGALISGDGSNNGSRDKFGGITFIDEAVLNFGTNDARVNYNAINTGSIFTSPDNSPLIVNYRQVSTRPRLFVLAFQFVVLASLSLLLDYGITVWIPGAIGYAVAILAAGPVELIGLAYMFMFIKKAHQNLINRK